jgi:uncharacterized membrane protein YeaQ/YmgE (transglycosylase-associated protein family)
MVILNCVWVGALAGLVASRLIRVGQQFAPVGSSVAVGVLSALVGGLADARFGGAARSMPHADIVAAGIAAAVGLMLWAVAKSCCAERRDAR